MEQEQQEIYARIAAAHQELAEAYAELAGADEEEEEEEEKPKRTRSNGKATNGNGKTKPTTTRTRSRKAAEEEDDDDDGDGDGDDGEEEEITLESLQELGDKLIKAKRKSALLTILKSFKAANISGIKKRDYPEVHAAMQDILE